MTSVLGHKSTILNIIPAEVYRVIINAALGQSQSVSPIADYRQLSNIHGKERGKNS